MLEKENFRENESCVELRRDHCNDTLQMLNGSQFSQNFQKIFLFQVDTSKASSQSPWHAKNPTILNSTHS